MELYFHAENCILMVQNGLQYGLYAAQNLLADAVIWFRA